MKIGFITPNYPNEKRVAILPKDIDPEFNFSCMFQHGFGETLDISDDDYEKAGSTLASREEIFESCDYIFSLKLIQESDYKKLRAGQTIIGWTHPSGSGRKFFNEIAKPLNITIVDLDNIYPKIYKGDHEKPLEWLDKNFILKNSFYAGYAATQHALLSYGLIPNSDTEVAVLSPGNVSQGALSALSSYNPNIRLFYRNTMNDFYRSIGEYDIVVNGIESTNDSHIISLCDLKKAKEGLLIIDAAADAGGSIEGTYFTTHQDPIGSINKSIKFYCINNAPTLYYRTVSNYISKALSRNFFKKLTPEKIKI